ncbi:MAG: hypothetical protein M0P17_10020 [Methanoculleus sp.]|nr:hypothetical protein [Methanoculleus sp.]
MVAQLPCDPADPLKTENGPSPPENAGRRGSRYARTLDGENRHGRQSFTIILR